MAWSRTPGLSRWNILDKSCISPNEVYYGVPTRKEGDQSG